MGFRVTVFDCCVERLQVLAMVKDELTKDDRGPLLYPGRNSRATCGVSRFLTRAYKSSSVLRRYVCDSKIRDGRRWCASKIDSFCSLCMNCISSASLRLTEVHNGTLSGKL